MIKLKRNLPTEPYPITHTEHRSVDYLYDDDEQVTSQQSYQTTLQDQEEIIEREDRIHQIECSITDVNEMMHDLANLTHCQGNAVGNDDVFCKLYFFFQSLFYWKTNFFLRFD